MVVLFDQLIQAVEDAGVVETLAPEELDEAVNLSSTAVDLWSLQLVGDSAAVVVVEVEGDLSHVSGMFW